MSGRFLLFWHVFGANVPFIGNVFGWECVWRQFVGGNVFARTGLVWSCFALIGFGVFLLCWKGL